ncbi:pilus assembly protein HicB [Segatella copri]|uniref:pilus assembly protein HicB n=1 Tax=Segatella copri TaxID=165179 RepID=UPI003F8C097A
MKVQIIVEQASDGKFWCYTEQGIGDVGLSAIGDSVAAAKADLMECYEEARQDAEENGKTFPEVEFEYKYDLQSFFNYFSFLNVSDIAKRAGINPSLMRQYASGVKTAGEKTYQRLNACMSDIKADLQAAVF